ncbi:hypothetical protein [Salinigranum marinum]|uniref:hypothetical protein n=1 Tax=Salinigranum marinum TaxID=1515595 RepID=UPI002989EA79|nr:hypothetical protein [Salinigranum marinum]
MDTAPEYSLFPGWERAVEWQYEAARATLERSLGVQRTVVNSWVKAAESTVPPETPQRAHLRRLEWGYDIWEEALLNTLVHLDDAVSEEGIDLRQLQMTWLHAMDDAFSEVMSRPVFAAGINDTLEDALTEQQQLSHLRRDLLYASNLPTDRDVEAVGERLLDLEARQKKIEEKLDMILDAADIEEATHSGVVE